MKRYFLVALSATMIALAGSTAFAEGGSDNGIYSAMDDNGDGVVSEAEFDEYYMESDIFDVWDVNDDGWIDDEEFADGLYDYYDDDTDGFISEGEWEATDDPDEAGFWDL